MPYAEGGWSVGSRPPDLRWPPRQVRQRDADLAALVDARYDEAVALASDLFDYAELGYLETRSAERLAGYLEGNGFSVETRRRGHPHGVLGRARQRRSGHRNPGGIRCLAGLVAGPGAASAAGRPRRTGPGLRPPSVRRRLDHGGRGGCGLVGEHRNARNRSALRHTCGGGWLRQGLPDPGRASSTAWTSCCIGTRRTATSRPRRAATATSPAASRSGGLRRMRRPRRTRGRSALDGVEAMNYMTNLMREHMPSTARLHYVITDGGRAPNIVPERAQVYYYVRHPRPDMVEALFRAGGGGGRRCRPRDGYANVIRGHARQFPVASQRRFGESDPRPLGTLGRCRIRRSGEDFPRPRCASPCSAT